jgi:ABC-type transport system involved in cytochrome c biogenesis ATPase subunit
LVVLLQQRVERLRSVGMQAQQLPLILDEPFENLDLRCKRWLLEALVRSAGQPQIVLLTADEEVITWARQAEAAGDVAVREPAPTRPERYLSAVS